MSLQEPVKPLGCPQCLCEAPLQAAPLPPTPAFALSVGRLQIAVYTRWLQFFLNPAGGFSPNLVSAGQVTLRPWEGQGRPLGLDSLITQQGLLSVGVLGCQVRLPVRFLTKPLGNQ